MKLEGKKWENYSTPNIDSHKNDEWYKKNLPERLELNTCSVQELYEKALWLKENCEKNHKDADEVPVFVEFDNKRHVFTSFSFGYGNIGTYGEIQIYKSDELQFTAPDSKPEVGEYWSSRGPGYDDCSGFVKSKKAGERIRRLVRYVLDKDEIKSWLDYRDYEPDWIQFKFSAEEFDVEKLDHMSNENDGIITEQILRECVI